MSLEMKKIQLELMRVKTARMELEYKIEERKDEIRRLGDHVVIQIDKEIELENKLKEIKE